MKDRRQRVTRRRVGRIALGYKDYVRGRKYKSKTFQEGHTWQNAGNRLAEGRTLEEVLVACRNERPDLWE